MDRCQRGKWKKGSFLSFAVFGLKEPEYKQNTLYQHYIGYNVD